MMSNCPGTVMSQQKGTDSKGKNVKGEGLVFYFEIYLNMRLSQHSGYQESCRLQETQ